MFKISIRTLITVPVAIALVLGSSFLLAPALAGPSATDLPPNWHVHDGQTSLGSQHKGIGFFPRILDLNQADYLQDPARCPNATDKAFLPSFGDAQSDLLRAGVCVTSTVVIQVRTVRVGTDGPEGWLSLTSVSEPGWVTYYEVTTA